jgi:hypothetical protein
MKSKVYVLTNKNSFIVRVDGGYTTPNDVSGWILIDEGEGDRYNLCQSNYFQESIITSGGAYRYKMVNGKAVECTPEEIKAQEEANKPAPVEPEGSVWDELDAAYQEGVDSV